MNRRIGISLSYLLLTVVLCLFGWHEATRSAALSLSRHLSATLPEQLEAAFRYQPDFKSDQLVSTSINANLASLTTEGRYGAVRQCTARLESLDVAPNTVAESLLAGHWLSGKRALLISWRYAGTPHQAGVLLHCNPAPAVLLLTQGALAALLVVLLVWVPGQWHRRIPWFLQALKQHPGQPLSAIRAALAPNQLVIDPSIRTVTIHGIDIPLSSTPFFYYLWYAQRRVAEEQNCGWYMNPAANRSDPTAAEQIRTLMSAYGGHAKAINELDRQGLRARVLDRNRNRIKEEMVAALGEHLASNWLFESHRDPVSQRHAYRLVTLPDRIHLKWDVPMAE